MFTVNDPLTYGKAAIAGLLAAQSSRRWVYEISATTFYV